MRDIARGLRFLTGSWSSTGNAFTEETWSTHQAHTMVGWRRTVDDDRGVTTAVEFCRIVIEPEGATLDIVAPQAGLQLTLQLARLGERAVFETPDASQRIDYWLDDGALCRTRHAGALVVVDRMPLLFS